MALDKDKLRAKRLRARSRKRIGKYGPGAEGLDLRAHWRKFMSATKFAELPQKSVGRFWARVDKRGPDECWEWKGARMQQGYGRFCFKEETLRAHRVSWALAHGPIPDGLFVCHRCDNPPCVNPAHLFLGTRQDNMRDMVQKGRHPSKTEEYPLTQHPSLRPHGERNTSTKLTDEQVDEIRRLSQPGTTHSELARRFNVWPSTISRAVLGKTHLRRTVSLEEARAEWGASSLNHQGKENHHDT